MSDRTPNAKHSGPGWYRGDFHAHTTCSDGYFPPQGLLDAAHAEGLDFLAITDHNTIAAFEQHLDSPVMILPGIEVTVIEGHFNIFGLKGKSVWMDWYDSSKYAMTAPHTLSELLLLAQSENLVTSVNHPLLAPWEVRDLEVDISALNCIENWNDPSYPDNREENPRAVELWTNWLNAGYRITNIGGSDFHSPFIKPDPDLPAMRVGSPVTVVYAQELSVPAILDGLRQRRAYFSMGPVIDFCVILDGTEFILGADLGATDGEVTFKARVDGAGEQLTVRLVRNGSTVAETKASAPLEADWKIQLDKNIFAWFRLDVLDGEGHILAVTNPFFSGPAPRPGSPRFGDYIP